MKPIMLGIMLGLSMFCVSLAEADQKTYAWTTEYLTLPKGGFEIEYWLTASTGDDSHPGETTYEHQAEIEYGITDHWHVALYGMVGHGAGESPGYTGTKLETRYRFGERGGYIVDPLVYLEYKIGAGGESDAFEAKLVLAKDVGPVNIAYNQIVEVEFGDEHSTEHEYAAGISYALHHAVRIGIEGKGSFTENEHAIGPTLSWAGGRIWATAGVLFGLNSRTEDRQFRFVIGAPF